MRKTNSAEQDDLKNKETQENKAEHKTEGLENKTRYPKWKRRGYGQSDNKRPKTRR